MMEAGDCESLWRINAFASSGINGSTDSRRLSWGASLTGRPQILVAMLGSVLPESTIFFPARAEMLHIRSFFHAVQSTFIPDDCLGSDTSWRSLLWFAHSVTRHSPPNRLPHGLQSFWTSEPRSTRSTTWKTSATEELSLRSQRLSHRWGASESRKRERAVDVSTVPTGIF